MAALQLSRRAMSLISAYFALCILIRVTLSQQSVCQINDITNNESCYNEREVICDNYTDTSRSCLPLTVNSLSYDRNGATYTIEYGESLSYSENSFEVIALQLCYEKAIELTLNDVTCGMTCTSNKDRYISNSFVFSCNNLPNLIEVGLTIVLFRSIPGNPQCSGLKTKFVVIDTRDVNECSQGGTYNCSDKAQCIDEKCGYSCHCITGYRMKDDNYTCAPVDCGALLPVLHGHTSTNGTNFQSVATYTCDNGYNLVGIQNRTCESNAMWSGDEPECKAVDCGDLSAVVNGVVETVTTTFASVANYRCDNGYELIGPSTRMCQANGSWSDMDPLCKAVDCGNVDPPSSGAVNAPETTFQAVATYSCISGYGLVGDSIRTCQANGSWSGQIPQCNPVDCGALPPVFHGHTSTNGTNFQSVATYTCDNGYNVVGIQNRTCESNAMWSGDEPECKAVDCGDLSAVVNGVVETVTTTFASVANYSCDNGYELIGPSTRMCQANGSWSGMDPLCKVVDCGDLTPPLNGTVNVNGTVYESIAMYMCYDGYILMGEHDRLCLANGNWSNEEPLCEPVDCGSPPVPTNGSIFSQQTIFRSIAVYSCDIGFMLFGEKRRTCEAQGSWSGQTPTCNAVDCGPLTAPRNGTVDVPITTYEGVAFYNCSHGYNLVGERRRVCQANVTWSSEEPVCEGVDCGPPRVPQNTIINVTTTTFPSMAVYSCENGYDLNGPSTRMCQPDGSWSRLETSCTPVDCGAPPPLENGLIEVTTTTFQSVVLYKCDNGYNLEGEANRTCKSDRTWSGTQPVCMAIDCGQPSSPDNGYVDAYETSFSSKAVYICMEGYVLHGQQERECLADGTWSNEVPECQPIDCGALEQPIGGSVASESTNLSSVAMYNCLVGYMLSGNRTRQCQSDGSWSGEMPHCIPVDCGQLEHPIDGKVVTSATSFKSVASYMCSEGYVLVNGSANRTCQADAHWSGTEPTCIDVCMTEEHGCNLNTSNCISGHGIVAQRCKCKDGFQKKNDVCVKACRKERDWPPTASGCIHAIQCPTDYRGNVTRLCGEDGVWQNADNSTCENIAFMNFKNEVKELFENEANDENVKRVLNLVERLNRNVGVVNLTSDDLELAVDILNGTVAFLTQHLKNGGSDFSNQSVAVVGTMDQLLDSDMISLYKESNNSLGETLLKSSEGYVNYLASAIGKSGTTEKTINMTNIKLEALVLSTDQGDESSGNHYYPQEEPIPPGCHHLLRLLGLEPTYTPRVKIPYQLIKERARQLDSTQVPAGNAIIKNIEQLLPANKGLQRPVTSILSSQVSAADRLDQSTVLRDEPVSINFTIKDLSVSANESAKCVFWKFSSNGEGQWSSEGVTTKILDNGVVQCNSTHLTSFTVIVAINDFEIHPAYEYLTYIGVGVSLVCLFMTIIFFLSERKTLFSRVHYFVHLNLAIALFSAYLIFAVGTHFGAHKNVPCTIVAALLHFLFLAAFCWMLCEGVMLYLMLVVVFSSLSKKWWFFLILGWGPPVIFVAAGYTYGAFRGGYVDINTCWLANGGTRWFFIGPMIAIIVINVVFLVIVIGSLCKNGSKDARKQMDDKGKNVQLVVSLVKASIILLPLLGATWIFGLFALDEASSYVFGSLFIVCSSLQGLFIFIFHVLRSDRVWGRIKKKYGLFGSSTQSQSMTRQSTFRSSRNASFIADKKENGVKNSESCKPRHEGTDSGAAIIGDGEYDVDDKCEPVDLERQDQDNKPGVSIDSEPGSSQDGECDVKDNGEPIDMERLDQESKPGVSIDSEPSSSPAIDANDNMQ